MKNTNPKYNAMQNIDQYINNGEHENEYYYEPRTISNKYNIY